MKRVIILGSTGSIGTQTIQTIEHLNRLHEDGHCPERFEIVGLAAGSASAALIEQATRAGVRHVAVCHDAPDIDGATVLHGDDAAERLVDSVDCDLVVSAIVGAAGLPATFRAVSKGINVALANKETLVAAGDLVIAEARRTGAHLLPVDSEHAGAWLCLGLTPPLSETPPIRKLTLTASGGPFRTKTLAEIHDAPPDAALRHPTWAMGPKNTLDSASLMNKALELIEAHHLFNLPASKLEAVIHPQSVVHAMVEHDDGSIAAQLSVPDMRLPIQQALTHPHRVDAIAPSTDLTQLADLSFERVDVDRWPAVALAWRAIDAGGTAGAIFNAANEAAVEAYLDPAGPRIAFGDIPVVVGEAMEAVGARALTSLDDAFKAEHAAKAFVVERLAMSRA